MYFIKRFSICENINFCLSVLKPRCCLRWIPERNLLRSPCSLTQLRRCGILTLDFPSSCPWPSPCPCPCRCPCPCSRPIPRLFVVFLIWVGLNWFCAFCGHNYASVLEEPPPIPNAFAFKSGAVQHFSYRISA